MDSIISIKNLTKTFGEGDKKIWALSDINLEIERGEIFGIIGLSGAGKSTLVRSINLLERPDYGSIKLDGVELTALSNKELRKKRRDIGMIFQGFNLLMQKTTLENVLFPLKLAKVPKKEAEERAMELLRLVDIEDKKNAYPAQLSGGQKQRVAIARALVTKPSVLLCDEATSALDPNTTDQILRLIKELSDKMNVTVIIITHEMKVVEQICSRVAIISDSRIVEQGPVNEVFKRPKSEAGRRLFFPAGDQLMRLQGGGELIRLIFDGDVTDSPILSQMVLDVGDCVNLLYADTRVIDGKIYGHTLIRMPENRESSYKMQNWLRERGINFGREDSNA